MYGAGSSPDGKVRATGSGYETGRPWDEATGRGRGTLRGPQSIVPAPALDPRATALPTDEEGRAATLLLCFLPNGSF